jgi:hypothetical protein
MTHRTWPVDSVDSRADTPAHTVHRPDYDCFSLEFAP